MGLPFSFLPLRLVKYIFSEPDLMFSLQLKNSAASPSRVTMTGNEIEIELSADAVTEGTSSADAVPPQQDEKENNILHHQHSATLEHPAFVRSGGVMCRGGGVSGPRFRMPVSSPQPVSSGLLLRHPTQQMVVSPQLQQQVVPGPQPVVGGSFSCPFCSLTFIDSPALYEHLSILHTVDQKTKWKQPRGREGKTIIPVKKSGKSPGIVGQGELGPPVLAPVVAFNRSGGADGQTADTGLPETGLFEDPVEPEATKKQRGRPPKQEGATPTKRQKIMAEDDDGDDDEIVSVPKSKHRTPRVDSGTTEKQTTPAGAKRGGRTPRGRRRS